MLTTSAYAASSLMLEFVVRTIS